MTDHHRKMGPLAATHPVVGETCLICSAPLLAGDLVTLAAIGPDDEENRNAAARGVAHTTRVVPIHWDCRPGTERFEAACAAVRMMLGDEGSGDE